MEASLIFSISDTFVLFVCNNNSDELTVVPNTNRDGNNSLYNNRRQDKTFRGNFFWSQRLALNIETN